MSDTPYRMWKEECAETDRLERELAAAKAWKDAVIEKLAITWAITSENENCPQKAIDDLVASQVAIALDPAVSSDAAALIERGRQEMRAEVERLRGIVPEFLEKLNDELCAENERLRTQVEALRADAADFHMAYRIRGGHLAVASEMIDSLRAEVEALRAAQQEFVRDYENGDMGDLKHYARAMRAALAKEKA